MEIKCNCEDTPQDVLGDDYCAWFLDEENEDGLSLNGDLKCKI